MNATCALHGGAGVTVGISSLPIAPTVGTTRTRVLEKTAAAQSAATLRDSGYDVAARNWPGDTPANSLKSAFMCDWS